jgi:DNA-binding transcriptional LysR family regulator
MESARCKAFLKAVELGSFRAAADDLGYTPSAVSQLVAALEKELGVSLLTRSKKGVTVTPEGVRFVLLVRSFIARETDIYQLASELRGMSVGELSIAAYPSVATTWLPEIVRRFQARYPGVNISIMEGVRPEIFHHLDLHEADMGFMAYAEPMNYDWIPLAEEKMIAVIPEDHPLADAESYPISNCEDDNFIMTSWGQDKEILDIFERCSISPNIKYTTYDTPAALAMVRMGLGVSFVNELSAQYWNDHLVKLPLDPPQTVTFGIVLTSEEHMTMAARKFLNYAVKYLTESEQK